MTNRKRRPAKLIRQFWDGQFELWIVAARKAGQTFADWARTRLDAAAKKETQ